MQRPPHLPASWLAAGHAALVLLAVACQDPAPPARGFGSRQLLQTTDRTLTLVSFGTVVVPITVSSGDTYYNAEIDPTILHYRTGDLSSPDDLVYWSLNLTDGSVVRLGSQLPDIVIPPAETATKYLKCSTEGPETGFTVLIEDPMTGTTRRIDRTTAYAGCPRADDPYFLAVRIDDGGRGRLWSGPYFDLQQARLSLSVDRLLTSNLYTVTDPAERRVTFVGASDAAPDQLGIHEVDLFNLTATAIVPPDLMNAVWATGATPEGPVDSDRLAPESVPFVAGPQIFYRRRMSDGIDTLFVRASGSGELALFRAGGTLQPLSITSYSEQTDTGVATRSINATAWHHIRPSPTTLDLVRFWDREQARLVTCPLLEPFGTPPPMLTGFPMAGGRNVLFAPTSSSGDEVPVGPLLVISRDAPPEDACRMLATDRVFAQTWSSEALAWLQHTDESAVHQLWTATLDGRQARLLGTGWLRGPRFISPFELDFYFGTDLISVDVRDDPVRERYLAEEVYGAVFSSTTTVVTGYDYNSQDATGTLGVINRSTGERRIVSRAVDQFRLLYRRGDGSLTAVYFVRGRNPSTQDGIWIASIPADDLE